MSDLLDALDFNGAHSGDVLARAYFTSAAAEIRRLRLEADAFQQLRAGAAAHGLEPVLRNILGRYKITPFRDGRKMAYAVTLGGNSAGKSALSGKGSHHYAQQARQDLIVADLRVLFASVRKGGSDDL